MSLTYRIGDATAPIGEGNKIIVHCCNDVGLWGAGFVLALNKWPEPKAAYLAWCEGDTEVVSEFIPLQLMALGKIQVVKVAQDTYVCNLIGQHGVGQRYGHKPPIRYHAITDGLLRLAIICKKEHLSVHMPRMGSDLAGGEWSEIEKIIRETLIVKGIDVTVYDLYARPGVTYAEQEGKPC